MIFSNEEKGAIWTKAQSAVRDEPTPRQWALYRLLKDAWPSKEHPLTQQEVISALPEYYQARESARNNDLCRSIYTDIDELNMSQRTDFLIGRTNSYEYYILQSEEEIREYATQYLMAMARAEQRLRMIESKYQRNLTGQGKLLKEGREMSSYGEGECGFHPNLKEEVAKRKLTPLEEEAERIKAMFEEERRQKLEEYYAKHPEERDAD